MTFTQQLFNMLNYIFRFCEKKMPHQIIEYSSNLETKIDIDGLVAALHNRAAELEPLPLAGLRTRAFGSTQFRVADSDPTPWDTLLTASSNQRNPVNLFKTTPRSTTRLLEASPQAQLAISIAHVKPRNRLSMHGQTYQGSNVASSCIRWQMQSR